MKHTTCTPSVEEAKAAFVAAVSRGIETLTQQCGYSRDRATRALLRELSRGEPNSRPSDDEVFMTMRRNNLGIEEASRSMVVTLALRRALETAESPAHAILQLASKIAVNQLVKDAASKEGEHHSAVEERLPIHMPVEPVEPVAAAERPSNMPRKASTPLRKSKPATKAPRARKTPAKPVAPPANGRKRTMDELDKPEAQNFRPRADSVSKVVSAKIAQESASSQEPPAPRTAANVRSKRALREDSEAISQPPVKRVRPGDDKR